MAHERPAGDQSRVREDNSDIPFHLAVPNSNIEMPLLGFLSSIKQQILGISNFCIYIVYFVYKPHDSSLTLRLTSLATKASGSTGIAFRSTLCVSAQALTLALLMTASEPPFFFCSNTSIACSVAMMSSGTMYVFSRKSCTVRVFLEGHARIVRASVCDQ